MDWIQSSSYTLPNNVTPESVRAGIIELVRPCSPLVTASFVTLQAFKPMYEADQKRIDIVYEGLYRDVKDLPEVAVVLACDDLRNCESRWFPIDQIKKCSEEYRDLIVDATDFFKGDEK